MLNQQLSPIGAAVDDVEDSMIACIPGPGLAGRSEINAPPYSIATVLRRQGPRGQPDRPITERQPIIGARAFNP